MSKISETPSKKHTVDQCSWMIYEDFNFHQIVVVGEKSFVFLVSENLRTDPQYYSYM